MQIFANNAIVEKTEFLEISFLRSQLVPFLEKYRQRPFEDNSGGVAIAGSFGLYELVRRIKPNKIIESGVWKGHTTWLLGQAAPDAQLVCFDPRISDIQGNLKFVSESATYKAEDFGSLKFKEITSGDNVLAFFDDHQDAMERVGVSVARGIKHVVFDDNYFGEGGHRSVFHVLRAGGVEAALLKAVVEFAYVSPPIFKWEGEKSDIAPLVHDRTDILKPYFEDRSTYRWLTYLCLR